MGTVDFDDIEYEDDHVDAQAEMPPVLDPQVEKEIQLVLAGSTIVKSYDGTSQYSQRGPSACGLASVNAVRTVLEKERHGTKGADLVREMMSRRFIEDATAICAAWTSTAHLEVDDIYQFPLFSNALRLVATEFRQANYTEFGRLLRRLEQAAFNVGGKSAAAIITKPPEILAVFAIATGHSEPVGSPIVYAVFDSHSRPDLHPNGAAFSFFGKAAIAAEYLSNLMSFDMAILNDEHLHWQTQLLSQYSGHVFVSKGTPPLSKVEMEMELFRANIVALESKSAVAEVKASMTELQAKSATMISENLQLNDRIQDLNAQVERLKLALDEASRDRDEALAHLIQAEEESGETREPSPWKGKGKEKESLTLDDKRGWASTTSSSYKPPATFRERTEASTGISISNPLKFVGNFFGGSSPAEHTAAAPSSSRDSNLHRESHRQSKARDRSREGDKDRRRSGEKAHRSQELSKTDKELFSDLQRQTDANEEPAYDQARANSILTDIHYARELQEQLNRENDIIREEHFALLRSAQQTFDCPICMEKCPEDALARLDGCEHKFCRDCLRGHVESSLKDRKFPVPCPLCIMGKREELGSGGVTLDVIETLGVSEEKYEIWLNMELAKFSILLDCPKCRQSVLVDRDDHATATILSCPVPECGHMWCKKCYQTVESEVESEHSCDGSKELDKLIKKYGWKRCPGCQTPTARTYGCNHMTCGAPGCNTHFCYVNGAFICKTQNSRVAKDAVDAHYRTCNLFDIPGE